MRVVDAAPEHLEEFLGRPIRQVDVDEWVLATGQRVSMTLLDAASGTRALLDERGHCICLWGVVEDAPLTGIGSVWLIASVEAERRARAIHRFWRREITRMHAEFPVLVALSYHRNTLHHDWLRAIGFFLHRSEEVGPFGVPYAVYVRRKKDHP